MPLCLLLAAPAGSDGLIGKWSPGIGDPNFVGWLTVVAYLSTAALSFGVVRRTPRFLSEARRERFFWLLLAWLFVALGINKQLDLQSAFTEIGRMAARQEGWYEERRAVQREFIVLVGVGAALGAAGLLFLVRGASTHAHVAAIGTSLVFAFVLIRAASFHHVDVFLRAAPFGVHANWVLELSGIGIVLAAAVRHFRRLPPIRPTTPPPRKR